MLIYVAIIFLVYFSCILNIETKNKFKYFEYIILSIVAIFICSGYMTGSDWRSYELYYNELSFGNFDSRMEYGFQIYSNIFKLIGLDFWTFIIINKLLVFILLVKSLRKWGVPIFLFLFLFLPDVGYYLFIDNPMRNFLALAIWIVSIKYLFERNFFIFLCLSVFASFFHIVALIMIPLYFAVNLKIKNWMIIALFILFNIIAYNTERLFDNINAIANFSNILSSRIEPYLYTDNYISQTINFGTLHRTLFMFFLIFRRKHIENENKYGTYCFNLAALSLLIYPFGMSMFVLQRFNLFISPFIIICTILAINSFKNKSTRKTIMIVLLSYCILRTILLVTYDYRYVPYTNYIIYSIKDQKPSYYERSNYNYLKSPYAK